jgi:hypothetical protein
MTGAALALLLASHERPDLDARAAWRWGVFLLWVGPIVMFMVGILPWPGGGAWYGSGAIMLTGSLVLISWALDRAREARAPQVDGATESGAQSPRPGRAPIGVAAQ